MFARFRKAVSKEEPSPEKSSSSSSRSTHHPPSSPAPSSSSSSSSSPSSSSTLNVISSGSQSRYLHTLREYSLLIEFKRLRYDSPSGLYVLPSMDSLRRWHGVIFIRKGFYRGGIFKFLIHIPTSYPDDSPRIQFISDVYHPLVNSQSGDVDSSIAFPSWNPQIHFIKSMLKFIKEIFYLTTYWERRNNVEPFNHSACQLWTSSPEEFHKKVMRCCSQSVENVFVIEEGASLQFMRPIPQHDNVWKKIVRSREEEEKREGERREKMKEIRQKEKERKENPHENKDPNNENTAESKVSEWDSLPPPLSKINFLSWFSNGIDRLNEGPPIPGMVSPYLERPSALEKHNLPLVAPPTMNVNSNHNVAMAVGGGGGAHRNSVLQNPTKSVSSGGENVKTPAK